MIYDGLDVNGHVTSPARVPCPDDSALRARNPAELIADLRAAQATLREQLQRTD